MSGNWSGTYESFLSRCIGGIHKEQEAFPELAKAMEDLKTLEERGMASGLQEGWVFEGPGKPTESYRKGKEVFEKEGDVYALLAACRTLAEHCEEVLIKHAQEEEEARRKCAQQEAEEWERIRQAKAKAAKKILAVICLVLFVALMWFVSADFITKAQTEAALVKTKAEITAMHVGARAGETMAITLPGSVMMEMVWCPPGTFTMGGNGDMDKTPHHVTLTKGFWMGKYEVTQSQWKSVMGNNPSYHKGDDLPVESVSWNGCQEFCKKTGLQLPTEAQWEYACRAGSTGEYAGTGILDDMGWYRDNSDVETHPVGTKRPNVWGLYDMHGNVCEWCADWYGDYPSGPVTDQQGPPSGSYRVLRGGSWYNYAYGCSSSFRLGNSPSNANVDLGFRLVRTLSE